MASGQPSRAWRTLGFPGKPQTDADRIADGRARFLCAVELAVPDVLRTLFLAEDVPTWARMHGLDVDWIVQAATRTRTDPDAVACGTWAFETRFGWTDDTRHAEAQSRAATHAAGGRVNWNHDWHHFVWLARYQVGGEYFTQIADDPFRAVADDLEHHTQETWDARAIAQACRRLAARLGLPLRPAPRGRPR